MTRLSTATLLSVLIGGLTACSSSYKRSSLEPNALIPLSVGNFWSYTEVGGSETGRADVVESESRNDSSWFLYKEFGEIFWLKNDNEAQVEAVNAFGSDELPDKLEEEIVFYPPERASDSYQSSGGEIRYHPCERELTVPAGTFPCHAYTVDLGDGRSSVNYYSPGVGLIRNEFVMDAGTVIFELTDYRVE